MHRDSVEDGGIYAGALFFSVIVILFNGLAELSMTIARLPVFYKQRDLLFYPPWAYALPAWILKIPISCIEAAVWVFITYYIIGFDPNVRRWASNNYNQFIANLQRCFWDIFCSEWYMDVYTADCLGNTFCLHWLLRWLLHYSDLLQQWAGVWSLLTPLGHVHCSHFLHWEGLSCQEV